MKLLNLMLCGMLACSVANAQTDSTYLDLGRMRARKEFTQTTAIKASDLAQMPFTNLSDAIRLWVNGAYTDKSTMTYVVDGVMISDADAYSIYDIEEITIVQNALSQSNGAGYVQTLALITTKKGNGAKPHFSVAGQAFVVDRKLSGGTYNFNFFSQYNVTASAKIGKVAVGGSVNFLHDEMPVTQGNELIPTVPNLNRFRTHLWAETDLGEKSKISLHVNYAPQFGDGKYASDSLGSPDAHSMKFNDALVNATLQLQTAFTSALHNKFSAGYMANKQHGHDDVMYDYQHSYDSAYYNQLGQFENNVKGHTLFINDNISYNWRLKDWSIEPAVNLNFQAIKYESKNAYATGGPGLGGGGTRGWTEQNLKGNILTATPSLAITYKNIVSIQGGIAQDLSKLVQKDYNGSKAYPFVNVAANLLPAKTNLSWKLYGSYAKTATINNLPAYQINDLGTYVDNFGGTKPGSVFVFGSGSIYVSPVPKNYDQRYQAGTDFSFFKNRLTLGYNYLNTSDVIFTSTTLPGNISAFLAGKYTMERHQVSLVGQVLQGGTFGWRTGLFVNFFKNTINYEDLKISANQKTNSGGWTNRFAYKRLSLGVDLLYLLNAQTSVAAGKTEKHNSLLLQNVYLAYAINSKKLHNLNSYISSRNLADSNIMPLASDNRRFYGAGVKFDF
ncbi:hypothetical protein QEG73_09400 [Chitinophagaceae bacterium 26-R-25]|nr:hypothetical protein [Chitinophagaceae bacterium 26-R-25]